MKRIKISGTGCCLADYVYTGIHFHGEEFQKYISKKSGDGGLAPGKLVFREEFEAFTNEPFEESLNNIANGNRPDAFSIGGPGIVALIHIAQILYRYNVEIDFYGVHGKDPVGKQLKKELEKIEGVNLSHYVQKGNKTPYTIVFSDSGYNKRAGERVFINNIGSGWKYTAADLDDDFFISDIAFFGGTALVPRLHDGITPILEKAKQKGAITVVNTVFDFRNEKKYPNAKWPFGDTDKSFDLIDLLILDYIEALRVSGESDINLATEFFIKKGVATLIITQGADHIRAYSNGSLFKKVPLRNFPVSDAVIHNLETGRWQDGDTTGCGDNFVGGVTASLVMQLPHRKKGELDFFDAIAWGVASGGFACSFKGGTYFEKQKGEKYRFISDYVNLYKEQIEQL